MPTNNELLKELGIDIRLTRDGLQRLSLMIADGCPRKVVSIAKKKQLRIECKHETIDRKTCYKCWYNWFFNNSTMEDG